MRAQRRRGGTRRRRAGGPSGNRAGESRFGIAIGHGRRSPRARMRGRAVRPRRTLRRALAGSSRAPSRSLARFASTPLSWAATAGSNIDVRGNGTVSREGVRSACASLAAGMPQPRSAARGAAGVRHSNCGGPPLAKGHVTSGRRRRPFLGAPVGPQDAQAARGPARAEPDKNARIAGAEVAAVGVRASPEGLPVRPSGGAPPRVRRGRRAPRA